MMKLLSVETTAAGRKALVQVFFMNEAKTTITEKFWLVGEMPFYNDDATAKLEFALMGTIKFSNSADAIKFYADYKCQQSKLEAS